MNIDSKRGRSPSSPQVTLERAIEMARNLHAKVGRAAIARETAIGPMGFKSMHGAALIALSSLSHYGLIDAERGGNLRISDLTLHLIHPLSKKQEEDARRDAALHPVIFRELHDGGYTACEESVLANHLIQSDFTPDGARKVAAVYRANVEFAKLSEASNMEVKDSDEELESVGELTSASAKPLLAAGTSSKSVQPKPAFPSIDTSKVILHPSHKMLAQYNIPLGANEATLAFTGERLTVEDFDDLIMFIEYAKRQFQRAKRAREEEPDLPPGMIMTEDGPAIDPGF